MASGEGEVADSTLLLNNSMPSYCSGESGAVAYYTNDQMLYPKWGAYLRNGDVGVVEMHGSICLAVGYRGLNRITSKDRYLLPLILGPLDRRTSFQDRLTAGEPTTSSTSSKETNARWFTHPIRFLRV
jgi:hypothetical protein